MTTKDISEKRYPIGRNKAVGQARRLSYDIFNPMVFRRNAYPMAIQLYNINRRK